MADAAIDIKLMPTFDLVEAGKISAIFHRTDWSTDQRKTALAAVCVAAEHPTLLATPDRQIH